jgi:hypothetical protein
MWNSTDGLYSNVFYGANFVDYIGYVNDKLTMIRPVNGRYYDSFIYNQYFDLTINGAAGADDVTLAAIAAIDAIPERVAYEDRAIVEAARAAYDKIATLEQQALVHNYGELISAEQRIIALTPTEDESEQTEQSQESLGIGWCIAIVAVAILAAGAIGYVAYKGLSRKASLQETPAAETQAEPVAEESAEEEVQEDEPAQEEPSEAE